MYIDVLLLFLLPPGRFAAISNKGRESFIKNCLRPLISGAAGGLNLELYP